MIATAATRSTIHSIRLAVVRRIASDYLLENGGLSLGLLLDCLRQPTEHPLTTAKNGTGADGYREIFRGATKQEMDALYEPTLNFLEVVYGPLECDAPNHIGGPKRWGYAAGVSELPGTPLTPRETVDLWARRARSLQEGHPDQRCWNNRRAPYTFWRRTNRVVATRSRVSSK